MSQHVISRVFNTIVKTEVDMRFSSYFIGWRFQLPLLDTLELKGRRDAMFNDETLLSSVEVEDDVQVPMKSEFGVGIQGLSAP